MRKPGERGDELNRIVAALETVSETLSDLDARLKSLDTRFEIHRHGPALAEIEITIKTLSERLDRHANYLRTIHATADSTNAQLRKLFHETSLLKRTAKLEESMDLFENF
jgi:hypothetical protein